MKKKRLPKTATLGSVITAVNDVKQAIGFIRKDSIDMESHLTEKIDQLKVQAEINHIQILDKLNKIIDQNEETGEKTQKLEKIHPNYTHVAI